jgi:hypothetical protein
MPPTAGSGPKRAPRRRRFARYCTRRGRGVYRGRERKSTARRGYASAAVEYAAAAILPRDRNAVSIVVRRSFARRRDAIAAAAHEIAQVCLPANGSSGIFPKCCDRSFVETVFRRFSAGNRNHFGGRSPRFVRPEPSHRCGFLPAALPADTSLRTRAVHADPNKRRPTTFECDARPGACDCPMSERLSSPLPGSDCRTTECAARYDSGWSPIAFTAASSLPPRRRHFFAPRGWSNWATPRSREGVESCG